MQERGKQETKKGGGICSSAQGNNLEFLEMSLAVDWELSNSYKAFVSITVLELELPLLFVIQIHWDNFLFYFFQRNASCVCVFSSQFGKNLMDAFHQKSN